jgi:hypothetical protein
MKDEANPVELTAREIAAVSGGEGMIGSGVGKDGGVVGPSGGKEDGGGGTIGSGT